MKLLLMSISGISVFFISDIFFNQFVSLIDFATFCVVIYILIEILISRGE